MRKDITADYKTLVAHLERTGRMKLLPKILAELRVREARTRRLAPSVEVASAGESAAALKAAAEFGITAEHAHVNHALIKGFRAQGGGMLIDRSAKRALIEIYQHITAH